MKSYSPKLRAQVVAEWQQGISYSALAQRHGVPRSTVQGWTRTVARTLPIPQKELRDELGELIYEFLRAGFTALIAQARAAGEPAFAATADDAWHQRFGVLADKIILVAGAVQRGAAGAIEVGPARESSGTGGEGQ